MGLKKRLGEVTSSKKKTTKPAFVELIATHPAAVSECVIEFESSIGSKIRIQWKGLLGLTGQACSVPGGSGAMIHITAQMRVLVAIEPVDGRKGIDSLVRVCQGQLCEDPMTGCVFVFRSRRGTSIRCSAMTARDIGLRKSVFPKGGSRGGLNRAQRRSGWRLTKRSC